MRTTSLLLVLALSTPFTSAIAQEADAPTKASEAKSDEPADEEVASQGRVVLADGSAFDYTAHTGRMVLRTEEGEPRASIFYVHYAATAPESATPSATRPLTYCFNGGPGSSSVWLHLGAFGPKRIDMGPEGFDHAPPFALADNAHTLLAHSDLVFVDPVTTGFSRAAKGVDDGEFHGVTEDVESVGAFIRLFTTRAKAWNRPVYLAGESYGTARAAALAHHLQERYGLYPSGLVLVSSILNWQTARFDEGNDLPYALFLPTYAAIAAFHGKVEAGDQTAFLERVRAFASTEYTLALMKGDALTEDERRAIAQKLHEFTGLSIEWLLAANLRIEIGRFCKELRRADGLTVGRLDGRYVGTDRDSAGERNEYDPSMSAILGAYSMALNQYVREELLFENDLPYEILTGRVQPWKYGPANNEYLNVGEDLRRAMNRNKALRVFVANGYHDLATPFFATEYTFDHLQLPAELRGNVQMAYYDAGHMMYVRRADHEKLAGDLGAFYAAR